MSLGGHDQEAQFQRFKSRMPTSSEAFVIHWSRQCSGLLTLEGASAYFSSSNRGNEFPDTKRLYMIMISVIALLHVSVLRKRMASQHNDPAFQMHEK